MKRKTKQEKLLQQKQRLIKKYSASVQNLNRVCAKLVKELEDVETSLIELHD